MTMACHTLSYFHFQPGWKLSCEPGITRSSGWLPNKSGTLFRNLSSRPQLRPNPRRPWCCCPSRILRPTSASHCRRRIRTDESLPRLEPDEQPGSGQPDFQTERSNLLRIRTAIAGTTTGAKESKKSLFISTARIKDLDKLNLVKLANCFRLKLIFTFVPAASKMTLVLKVIKSNLKIIKLV